MLAARRQADNQRLATVDVCAWSQAPVAPVSSASSDTLMKKLALAALAISLAIVGFSFVTGVVAYMHGSAHMWAVGKPSREFGNLDRRYRVHWQTSCCMVHGPELLTHPANNAAIAVMTTLFGPMPGTYHGPYPDRAQAHDALAGSQHRVALEALEAPLLKARDCETLKRLFPPQPGMPAARCALFRDSTFVLGFEGYALLRAKDDGARYATYFMGTDEARLDR
jgi:hypothetical protein